MGKIERIGQGTWRPLAVATAMVAVSAVTAFGMNTLAQAEEPQAPNAASAPDGHHPGHHGFFPRGPGPEGFGGPGMLPLGGPGLEHLLREAKATDAQRTQIKAIAKAAEADLKPLRDTGRSLHEQTLALFAQPQVDAAAAEQLRQQGLANHDAVSKRVLQAALDVSKVLTPEQRASLAAKAKKRRDWIKAHAPQHPRDGH